MTDPARTGELIALLSAYINADGRLGIWRDYPDVSEEQDHFTDGWACEEVSAQFAAFARSFGWDAVVIHGEDAEHPLAFDHAWVRLTRDGVVSDVDWTARQFHNLHTVSHDPAVLTLPWPLAWDPAIVEPDSHLIVGRYNTIKKEDR
ncbi:MAG TPA: hypothetical protein VF885_13140 [Arthrobacter sp.]